jgi:glycosyltransferase involved in cell wall biosynthesis
MILELLTTLLLLPIASFWMWQNDVDGIHATAHDMFWVSKVVATVFRIPCVTFVGYTPSLRVEKQPIVESLLERLNFQFFMGDTVLCRVPSVCDKIERLSNSNVDEIHGVVNSKKAAEAEANADIQEIRNRIGVEHDETLLVFVGRLTPKKNPIKAVEVVDDLPASYKLVFVGDGLMTDDVEKEITERGLDDRVFLEGELSHRETLQVLLSGDASILTSKVEAYPTVVFEGLAMGNTVFATPVGILPEISHQNLNLQAVNEMSIEIQATNIQTNHEVADDVLDRFSIQVYTDRVLREFEDLRAGSYSRR